MVVKVGSNKKAPVNGIALCVKGRFGYGFINSPDRLTTPMIKKEGKFQKATWDEALDTVAENLSKIKKQYGANSIAGLASAKCTNEENFLFQKFMRAAIGTNNVDHCARLCHASTVAGLARAFGSGAMTNTIKDIGEADVILVTGDAYVDHPAFGVAMIGRWLEKLGYRVGILAQPDWRSVDAFRCRTKVHSVMRYRGNALTAKTRYGCGLAQRIHECDYRRRFVEQGVYRKPL